MTWRTTFGKPYAPPPAIPNSHWMSCTVSGDEVPVYLSPDLHPLNRLYQEIRLPVQASPKCGESVFNVFTREQFPLVFRPQNAVDIRMPTPHEFLTLADFEEALRSWYSQCTRFFGFARLPSPISGTFHLPELPKIFSKEKKLDPGRFRTFKANLWPLLPENYLNMLEMVFTQMPIPPDERFRQQIPKREVIYHRHHVTDQNQWFAQLIPKEPLPFLYDSFKQYQTAYRNWAALCCGGLRTPIIRTREFESIAALDVFRPSQRELPRLHGVQFRVSDVCPNPRRFVGRMDLKWARASPGKVEFTLRPGGDDMVQLSPMPDIFGINKSQFIREHQNWGYSRAALDAGEPVRVPIIFSGRYLGATDAILQMLGGGSTSDFGFVRRLIDSNLSPEQFEEIAQFEETAAAISRVLGEPESVQKLTGLSHVSEASKFRVSFLLRSTLRNDPSSQLLMTLVQPPDLRGLFHIVSFLNLTSRYREPLLPLVRCSDRMLQTINLFYLISMFLSIMRDYDFAAFYRDALELCRGLARQIAESEPSRLEMYRRSTPGSDFYIAMLMIFFSDSVQLQRIFLGLDVLTWMSPRLLTTIEHSKCIVLAARLVLTGLAERVYEPLSDWAANLPQHHVYFIESACQALRQQALTSHVKVPPTSVMTLFDIMLSTTRPEVGYLVLPLSRLLCDGDIMSDFYDVFYQQRLTASVCWLCQELHISPPALYKTRIQALTILAHDEMTCFQMAKISEFTAFIIQHLQDTESSLIALNWAFFREYTKYPRVIYEILNSPLGTKLAEISRSDCNAILKKFFEFSIDLWKTQSNSIVEKFCDVMTPLLGRVTCIVRARRTMFKDDERLIQLVEDYGKTMIELTAPGAEKFIEAFGKHMEINDWKDDASRKNSRVRKDTQKMFSQMIEKEMLPI
jgi:hypothetical protein